MTALFCWIGTAARAARSLPVSAGGTLLILSIILVSRLVAARTALKSQVPRVLNLVAVLLLAGGLGVSGWATSGEAATQVSSYSNLFLVFFGTTLLLRLLPLVYYNPLTGEVGPDLCSSVYYLADIILTYFLNCVRYVLSLFDILSGLQAQLLFSTTYARQVGGPALNVQLDAARLAQQSVSSQGTGRAAALHVLIF